MKKFNYFLLILFVLTLSVFSKGQTITLNWEGLKDVYSDKNSSSKYPYFSNKNYSLDEGVPTLHYSEKSDFSGTISLSNLQWQAVDNSQLGNMPTSAIPEKDVYSASVSNARNQRFVSVVIKTFKRTGNQIYRLSSFTINKTNYAPSSRTFSALSNTESYLRTGDWYKIKVNKSGIYKIDRNLLQSLGVNVNSLNPKTIRIFGNGGKMLPEPTSDFRYDNLQENAIRVIGENDGVFNNEDYILFYAQGPDYWNRKTSIPRHVKNIYEDYAYYFINVNQAQGKRVPSVAYQSPNSTIYTEYNDYQFFEEELLNLNQVGKIWLGENLGIKNNLEINFPVHDLAASDFIWNFSWVSKNGKNGKVNVSYNGNNVYSTTLNPTSFDANYSIRNATQSQAPQNNQLKFTLNFDNSANPSAELYPDYFEVIYKQKLRFNGTQMNFRTTDAIENGNIYGFNFTPTEDFEVWDVSDIVNARQLVRASNTYNFSYQFISSDFKNEMVAFKHTSAYTPETVGRVSNQALHSITNADYIIITVPEFVTQANRLKTFHQSTNGLNVEVVTVNQIYNEFSSGGQDLAGIRDFLRYLYKKDNGKLKYVLLLGSASYDFKNKTGTGYNLIPAYQSYNSTGLDNSFSTDDFITILDDNEANMIGDDANLSATQLDIAVGRMIAKNNSESTYCIDKAIKYDNGSAPQGSPFGDWRLKTTLIVDIDDSGGYSFHQEMETNISKNIFETSLPEYNLRKLYTDAFKADYTAGGARFPQVTEAIKNALNNGNLVVNYFGHGGPVSISQFRLLGKEDITSLSNFSTDYSRLPLFITVSCDVSVWDNPTLNSLGDLLYLKENGGAGSMITTNRAITITYGLIMNPFIIKHIFTKDSSGKKFIPLGEALRLSKQKYINGDNRKVALIGDPAQSLARPKRDIRLTKINGVDANSFSGTLRALDFVTLEGQVLNESGAADTSFNGTIQTTLYDKPVDKRTLNNFNYSYLPPMAYKEQINAIYKGGSQVKNGAFKVEFYIPKDINYDIGDGKLLLYADNTTIDAFQTKTDIKIGDINPNGINDDEGPKIGLYMNNLNFANGGITDKSPYLLACVTDSTGINSTGLGIGHDITGILDNDVNGTIILNDFYTGGESSPCLNPDLKDYQKGKVWYRLYDLEPGNHTIKFKVWDINNNSSTATLDFIVVENGNQGLIVKKLLNWPNPFTTKTFFHFEHNCPEMLEVQVQVFTVSGKLVKTINKTVTSQPFQEGYRTDKYGIEWDGLDDFGDKIGKGVYIYRVKVRGTSETCKGSVSQVEKLVILK